MSLIRNLFYSTSLAIVCAVPQGHAGGLLGGGGGIGVDADVDVGGHDVLDADVDLLGGSVADADIDILGGGGGSGGSGGSLANVDIGIGGTGTTGGRVVDPVPPGGPKVATDGSGRRFAPDFDPQELVGRWVISSDNRTLGVVRSIKLRDKGGLVLVLGLLDEVSVRDTATLIFATVPTGKTIRLPQTFREFVAMI